MSCVRTWRSVLCLIPLLTVGCGDAGTPNVSRPEQPKKDAKATRLRPGDVQPITAHFRRPGRYDIFVTLKGPDGRTQHLAPDGTLGAHARPYLKGLKVSEPSTWRIHAWRVTGLQKGRYAWEVTRVSRGKKGTPPTGQRDLTRLVFEVTAPIFGDDYEDLLEEKDGRAVFIREGELRERFEAAARAERSKVVRHAGGSSATMSSTDSGLAWLAAHQEKDGRWAARKHGAKEKADTLATGLALLAFSSAGHTEKVGKYREHVRKGVAWLAGVQHENGLLQARGDANRLLGLSHAIAGAALAEAAGMARLPRTVGTAQKAVEYSTKVHARTDDRAFAGWGNAPGKAEDLRTTAWFAVQVKSAKVAGLSVRASSLEGIARYVKRLQARYTKGDKPSGAAVMDITSTAIALWCGSAFGASLDPWREAAQTHLGKLPLPKWDERGEKVDALCWYFTNLCAFQTGGATWRRWNTALSKQLTENQRRVGKEGGESAKLAGSWNPCGVGAENWGRVGQTSLSVLMQGVYYRYLPMYEDSVPLGGTGTVAAIGLGGGGGGAFGHGRVVRRGGGARVVHEEVEVGDHTESSVTEVPPGEPPEKRVLAGKSAMAKAKRLTAGESDDNREFSQFLAFLRKHNSKDVMARDVSQRRFITVLDAHGRHVPNAEVEVSLDGKRVFKGRTYANGQTLFCPSALGGTSGKKSLEVKVARGWFTADYRTEVLVEKDARLKNQFVAPSASEAGDEKRSMPADPGSILRAGVPIRSARALAAAARRAAQPRDQVQTVDTGKATPEQASNDEGDLESGYDRPVSEKPGGDWVLRVPAPVEAARPHLDIVFQIDTTGSMRDEIRSVQATVADVARRIDEMKPRPVVRWGLVLYGDRGDSYIVRRYPFTPDAKVFRKRVAGIEMTGGGDTPEAAQEALHASVNEMAWNTGNGIRLVFLIADAPPHLDYGRPYTYLGILREAVAKGIKVYPTAASGLDKRGEYIFRQCAQETMARFLFITYGAGTPAGGPGGKTPHEVKQPAKRTDLDDLIVGVVKDELSQWLQPKFHGAGGAEALKLKAPPQPDDDEF